MKAQESNVRDVVEETAAAHSVLIFAPKRLKQTHRKAEWRVALKRAASASSSAGSSGPAAEPAPCMHKHDRQRTAQQAHVKRLKLLDYETARL